MESNLRFPNSPNQQMAPFNLFKTIKERKRTVSPCASFKEQLFEDCVCVSSARGPSRGPGREDGLVLRQKQRPRQTITCRFGNVAREKSSQ